MAIRAASRRTARISARAGREDARLSGFPGQSSIHQRGQSGRRREAFDWNCPQHITPRFTGSELEEALMPVRKRMSNLELENETLRARVSKSRGLSSRRERGLQRRQIAKTRTCVHQLPV